MTSHTQQTVELQRSVRFGRLLIVGAILGAAIAGIACQFFPLAEDARYTMGQITGFMIVMGGGLGLVMGGLVALILSAVAKRKHGTGLIEKIDEPAAENTAE